MSSSTVEGSRFSGSKTVKVQEDSTPFSIAMDVPDPKLWTPESPHLYDLTLDHCATAGLPALR